MMRAALFRLKNLFVSNPRCCQPAYCKRVAPEDYAQPNRCKDCDPIKTKEPTS